MGGWEPRAASVEGGPWSAGDIEAAATDEVGAAGGEGVDPVALTPSLLSPYALSSAGYLG